jgi:hypothetical protein
MYLTCKQCGHTGLPQTTKKGPHISAYCMGCGCWIKHLPQTEITDDFILYFGKYKGRSVKSMVNTTPEEFNYLVWLRENNTNLKEKQVLILKNLTK